MIIHRAEVYAMTIYDAPALDPILVVFQDFAIGQGRVIVECFGGAWSCYFGAMSNRTIRQFVASASVEYLSNKLWPMRQRRLKREMKYLERILVAVKEAANSNEAVAIEDANAEVGEK